MSLNKLVIFATGCNVVWLLESLKKGELGWVLFLVLAVAGGVHTMLTEPA